jgi:uncharacterized delta-60 repeat protein
MLRSRRPLALAQVLAVALFLVSVSPHKVSAAPGDLDPSFNSTGQVYLDFGGRERAHAVAVQADGKVVVGGAHEISGSPNQTGFALARLKADGTLDPTFGAGGKVITSFNSPHCVRIHGLVLQPDGKIVAAGCTSDTGGRALFALARYNPDGSLDRAFGINGTVTTDAFGTGALAVALQSDGKIIAAGTSCDPLTLAQTSCDFALVRYSANGTLDGTFGAAGRVTTDFGGLYDEASALIIQADGKIIAAGAQTVSIAGVERYDFALARYGQNGSLDATFGTNGKVSTAIGADSDRILGGVLQADGKIVVVGYVTRSGIDNDFAIARYITSGLLDSGFGTGGIVTTSFGAIPSHNNIDVANAVAIQQDGKIIAAGYGGGDFGIARYTTTGNLDSTFGDGGRITTPFGSLDIAYAVAIQQDGKIIAAGVGGTPDDMVLARYVGSGAGSVAPAAKLAFTQQPSSTAVTGQPFAQQPQVTVQDPNGNTVTGYSGTVTLAKAPSSTGPGNLSCTGGPGPNQQTVVNGTAMFTGCKFDQPGMYVLRATSGSLAAALSNPIQVRAPTPAEFAHQVRCAALIAARIAVPSLPLPEGCDSTTPTLELKLPWPAGETWFYSSGPHCDAIGDTCPQGAVRYGVDFMPPGPAGCSRERQDLSWVVAAAGGTVRVANNSLVEIEHTNGLRTGYYHLRSDSIQVSPGQEVVAGKRLGRPSCEARRGGAATGVHVHFYVCSQALLAGAACLGRDHLLLPADGLRLSGWTVHASDGNRSGTMSRENTIKTADPRQCTGNACNGITNDIISDNTTP